MGLLAISPGGSAGAEQPGPQLGTNVVVEPVSGTVLVSMSRGAALTQLSGRQQIPVGSTVDASGGSVRLQSASPSGGSTQTGEFSGGAFVVTQEPSGLTNLTLAEGHRQSQICTRARQATVNNSVLRRLHSKVSGHFRTQGSYAAATVRGTEFTTEDRCDGTFVADEEGHVTVTDRSGEEVSRGVLKPGESSLVLCTPPGTVRSFFATGGDSCVDLTAEPAVGLYGFGVVTRRHAGTFEVCIRTPAHRRRCQEAALWPNGTAGVREQIAVCSQEGDAGAYTAEYLLDGKLVSALTFRATLPYTATKLGSEGLIGEGFCTVHFGGEGPRSFSTLWATVNVCAAGAVGIAASMPGTGDRREELLMRFRLQRLSEQGEWVFVAGDDTGYEAIGTARAVARRGNHVFQVSAAEAASGVFRGVVELLWQENDALGTYPQAEITTLTVTGHPRSPGAQPPSLSAATCRPSAP